LLANLLATYRNRNDSLRVVIVRGIDRVQLVRRRMAMRSRPNAGENDYKDHEKVPKELGSLRHAADLAPCAPSRNPGRGILLRQLLIASTEACQKKLKHDTVPD
jgi:hypothetical protein